MFNNNGNKQSLETIKEIKTKKTTKYTQYRRLNINKKIVVSKEELSVIKVIADAKKIVVDEEKEAMAVKPRCCIS